MAALQHYGIKFPVTKNSIEKNYVDLNISKIEDIKSQLMHLIFTPVGQRIRQPEFGSKLIQFLFNPNDTQTWGDVVDEIKTMVAEHIPDCVIKDVEVYDVDDGRELVAKISFTVKEGDTTYYDEIITNL